MKAYGLERTLSYFQGMEQLLSRLPWWAEVKSAADDLFAKERERQEQLELARAKAAAPYVYQLLPTARSGIERVEHADVVAGVAEEGSNVFHHKSENYGREEERGNVKGDVCRGDIL